MTDCLQLKVRLLAAQKREARERAERNAKREIEYQRDMMKRARALIKLLRKNLNIVVTIDDLTFEKYEVTYHSCTITYSVQQSTYGMFDRLKYQLWAKGIVAGGVKTVMADGTKIGTEVGYPCDDILALSKFDYFNPNAKPFDESQIYPF